MFPSEKPLALVLSAVNPLTILMIDEELTRAKAKFPKDFNSRHEGAAVLKEEVDELWDEVKADGSSERLRAEAIQVAAMAIRIIQELT